MARKLKTIQEPQMETAPGYLPDGASGFSHALARGRLGMVTKFRDRAPLSLTRLEAQIQNELAEVARHERRVRESKPGAEAKLKKTRVFLARLLAEHAELMK